DPRPFRDEQPFVCDQRNFEPVSGTERPSFAQYDLRGRELASATEHCWWDSRCFHQQPGSRAGNGFSAELILYSHHLEHEVASELPHRCGVAFTQEARVLRMGAPSNSHTCITISPSLSVGPVAWLLS